MIRKLLITMMFLMMISLVGAIEICEDTVASNTLCTLVTPAISCTNYSYDVYDNQGILVDDGALLPFNASGAYYANFTQDNGSYHVVLCDNTSRDLYVEGGLLGGINEVKGSMGWVAVAILMVCMTGFIGWGANMIKEPGLKHFKMGLFFLFITNSFMLGIIAFVAGVNAFTPNTFRGIGIGYFGVNLFMIMAFTINYSWLSIYKVYEKGRKGFRKAFDKGGFR